MGSPTQPYQTLALCCICYKPPPIFLPLDEEDITSKVESPHEPLPDPFPYIERYMELGTFI